MTDFTLNGSDGSTNSGADPAQVTASAAEGDDVFAWIFSRSDESYLNPHTLSDNVSGGGTWTNLGGHNNLITDPNARCAISFWHKKANAADAAGTFIITADDGGSGSVMLTYNSLTPSVAYDTTLVEVKFNGSGTGDIDNVSTGNTANPGGSNLLVLGFVMTRTSSDEPTSLALDEMLTGPFSDLGGNNQLGFASAFDDDTSGVKVATADTAGSGSGNEGIVGVAVFSDGPIAGAAGNPAAILVGL